MEVSALSLGKALSYCKTQAGAFCISGNVSSRGDVSRNTEGSGLGLAIAKSFTEAQGGNFHVEVDGDLFKVVIQWKYDMMYR